MKNLTIAALLFWTLSLQAQFEPKNYIDLNYIEVSGTAELEISPDLIFIRVRINEKDFKEPLEDVEKKLINTLIKIGVDTEKDLLLVDYTGNFKNFILKKNEVLLSKEYRIIAHDAGMVGKVYLELDQVGISQVSILRLDHSNITEFRKEVRKQALKAAREKAAYLAEAIGQDIGRAIHIVEGDIKPVYSGSPGAANTIFYINAPELYNQAGDKGIEFEKIRITATYDVKFELK